MNNYKNFTICIGKQNYGTILTGGNIMHIKSDTIVPTELPDLADYINVYIDDIDFDVMYIVIENNSNVDVDISYSGWIEDSDGSTSDYDDTDTVEAQSSTGISFHTQTGYQVSNYYFCFGFSATGYQYYETEIEN